MDDSIRRAFIGERADITIINSLDGRLSTHTEDVIDVSEEGLTVKDAFIHFVNPEYAVTNVRNLNGDPLYINGLAKRFYSNRSTPVSNELMKRVKKHKIFAARV